MQRWKRSVTASDKRAMSRSRWRPASRQSHQHRLRLKSPVRCTRARRWTPRSRSIPVFSCPPPCIRAAPSTSLTLRCVLQARARRARRYRHVHLGRSPTTARRDGRGGRWVAAAGNPGAAEERRSRAVDRMSSRVQSASPARNHVPKSPERARALNARSHVAHGGAVRRRHAGHRSRRRPRDRATPSVRAAKRWIGVVLGRLRTTAGQHTAVFGVHYPSDVLGGNSRRRRMGCRGDGLVPSAATPGRSRMRHARP